MKPGWEVKPLGEIADVSYGYTAKAQQEEVGPQFLRITDIKIDSVKWENVPFCKISEKDYEKHRLEKGDLVFARTGATTGKSFLIRENRNAVCASYLIKVRLSDSSVTPEFLSLYFQSSDYWNAVELGTEGAAQGGFNASKLKALQIPLPPLEEQRRIVALLDQAFEGLDRARANTETNLNSARELWERTVSKRFQQLESASGINLARLSDVAKIGGGGTPSKSKLDFWGGRVPWVSPKDMKRDVIYETQDYITDNAVENSAAKTIPAGACLIVVRSGILARTVPIAQSGSSLTINQDLKSIIPNDRILSDYLFCFLKSKEEVLLKSVTKGATVHRLATDDIKALMVPMLPKNQQTDLSEEMMLAKKKTTKIIEDVESKLGFIADLRQSLLAKAFAGELT